MKSARDLGVMDGDTYRRFRAICRTVRQRRKGLKISEMEDAKTLAKELSLPGPDSQKVEQLADRLGIEVEELDQFTTGRVET